MILYHGSNTKVTEIDLSKCRPYKDFGQGFYLTDIREQAEQMARRVVRLYSGSPFVSAFSSMVSSPGRLPMTISLTCSELSQAALLT